ncbi:MAG: 2-(1,2-epoxy-1,2-dihydrophenyl)acetyl-CoA isomerase PaaG [Melioribacteraceae bacterium]|nr:2-(1,2-epoxy-1,2-dihydrophenyl)acetyl-CoA isomerase PaaG [Melioribacteraceae bacterium]MCF8355415.1 2-(1,2-epoxy-1,2-dihydrophenyl)acetyl-CoA isomerase PaaG [Melioribacteraceae bacterium]MCF8393257.1 2-(1,2-epoxy-1,2-dihydrophenyl)acetyl-CoA isomerase PaaG [Melioribacteraceae bacterium]MCF8417558.1 2-(1,2-epoxy-1,2-dihydrophenyl)acetyl-CoA isomerase PaaG [Melioribacteraceae bacterium]
MSYKFIKYVFQDGVAIIKLNRPDVMNCFNSPMAREIQDALRISKDDKEVRSILITGEGKAFCAGQDLVEVLNEDKSPNDEIGIIVRENYNPIIRLLREIEKPIVCGVNGVAAGAGANIALACDIVFASKNASFLQAFSKIGLIPDSGGTFFLPKLVGLPRAAAMAMLNDKITAENAEVYGMIYKTVEHEELYNEALNSALYLAKQPTKALGLTKRLFNKSFENNLEEQLKLEEELQSVAGKSYDYKEGVKAFLEKRSPVFKGE